RPGHGRPVRRSRMTELATSGTGIVAYAAYLPRHRLRHADLAAVLGGRGGPGARVCASFDEDSTTMAVEAARRMPLAGRPPEAIFFATTSPAYLDKTNAAAVHAALGLGHDGLAVDLGGAAAFLCGEPGEAIAEIAARVSVTAEFLDRWRSPGEPASRRWEDRFGLESYLPLVTEAGQRALKEAGVPAPDHVVVTSPNPLVARRASGLFRSEERRV